MCFTGPALRATYIIRNICVIYVEGVTLVLPSCLFMFNKYWRILALS